MKLHFDPVVARLSRADRPARLQNQVAAHANPPRGQRFVSQAIRMTVFVLTALCVASFAVAADFSAALHEVDASVLSDEERENYVGMVARDIERRRLLRRRMWLRPAASGAQVSSRWPVSSDIRRLGTETRARAIR